MDAFKSSCAISLKGKSCLVTGSTGFVGSALVGKLLSLDCRVTVLARTAISEQVVDVWLQDLAKPIRADLPLDKIDYVFHLAGKAHDLSGTTQEQDYFRVNTEATLELAELAGKAGVKCFVFVSSVKAAGEPDGRVYDELTVGMPIDCYGRSKLAAEAGLRQLSERSAMQIAIVRPSLVYGPCVKGNLYSMLRAVDLRWFPPLPYSSCFRSMVSRDDLVNAILLIAGGANVGGKLYILSDGEHYTTRLIYDAFRQALGLPKVDWSIPMPLISFAIYIGEMLNKMGMATPFNKKTWTKLFGPAQYSAEKIRRELGWQPQSTFYDMVPEIVRHYRIDRK